MPANIEGMVNQYSKTAQGNANISDINVYDNRNKIFKIPLNLQFTPKIVFLNMCIWEHKEKRFVKVIQANQAIKISDGSNEFHAVITHFSKEKIEFKFTYSYSNGIYASIKDFFAIG